MLEIVREVGDKELVTADNSGVTDTGQGSGTHGAPKVLVHQQSLSGTLEAEAE